MPEHQTQASGSSIRPQIGSRTITRIDGPHMAGVPVSEPAVEEQQAEPALLDALDGPAELIEEMRIQAGQLAEQLRARQRELDHREAELNAWAATFEHERRCGLLWLNEQRHTLAEHEAELVERQRQLEAQCAQAEELEAQRQRAAEERADQERQRRAALDQRGLEVDQAQARVGRQRLALKRAIDKCRAARAARQKELDDQRGQIDMRRRASLALVRLLLEGVRRRRAECELREAKLQQRWQEIDDQQQHEAGRLQALAETLGAREQRLDEAEALLAAEQADCLQRRQALEADRAALETEQQTARAALAESQRQAQAALDAQRAALSRRAEQLDAQQAALEQTEVELRRVHRETLESRLAAEELMAQLSGTVPTAALTNALARLRGQLADHFRLASADIAQQREELEELRARLAEQHERLKQQRDEVQQWVARREHALEEQAARLVAREQELDWQESQLQRLQQRWQEERQGYQQEIRRLLAELRREPAPA